MNKPGNWRLFSRLSDRIFKSELRVTFLSKYGVLNRQGDGMFSEWRILVLRQDSRRAKIPQ